LISNFEDGCVKSLWEKSIADIRRRIVRIQNHVVMLFFTGVSSVQKPIDSLARLILALRASLDSGFPHSLFSGPEMLRKIHGILIFG
jgi:hypothetical protein